jgi:hypothetical protein
MNIEVQLYLNGQPIEKPSFPVRNESLMPTILLIPHLDGAGRRMGCLEFHQEPDGRYELWGYRPYEPYVVNMMMSNEPEQEN